MAEQCSMPKVLSQLLRIPQSLHARYNALRPIIAFQLGGKRGKNNYGKSFLPRREHWYSRLEKRLGPAKSICQIIIFCCLCACFSSSLNSKWVTEPASVLQTIPAAALSGDLHDKRTFRRRLVKKLCQTQKGCDAQKVFNLVTQWAIQFLLFIAIAVLFC